MHRSLQYAINFIIIPYIFFYYIKVIKQFGCDDKGDNPVDNPNI